MVRPPQPTRRRRRPSRSARRSGVQGKGSAGLQRRAAAATPRPPPKTGGPKRGFPRPSDPVAAAAERLAAAMPTLVTLALKAAGRGKPTVLRVVRGVLRDLQAEARRRREERPEPLFTPATRRAMSIACEAAGVQPPTSFEWEQWLFLRDQLLRPAFTALELSHQRHLDARRTALTYGLPAPTPGATAGGPALAPDGAPAPPPPPPPGHLEPSGAHDSTGHHPRIAVTSPTCRPPNPDQPQPVAATLLCNLFPRRVPRPQSRWRNPVATRWP